MTALGRSVIVGALGAFFGISACDADLILSAHTLDVGPDPAAPGETVVVSFYVDLVPTQSHTMTVFVDGTEHLRVDDSDAPAIPVVLELGDAADLIATYGTGEHVVHVEVRANSAGKSARSGSVVFELVEAKP